MIIKISAHGKGDNGYILLDIMVALFVAAIGFTVIFGAIRTAVDYSVKRDALLMESIALRNKEADEFETIIFYE